MTVRKMTVDIETSDEMREAVLQRVLGFYSEHGVWSGDAFMDAVEPVESSLLLAELLDDLIAPHATIQETTDAQSDARSNNDHEDDGA